jgi:peptide/nickel transport system permease protein
MALMLGVILGVTVLTFVLMHMAPGDAAEMVAQSRYGSDLSHEQVEMIRIGEGLNRSLPVQYLRWLSRILRGDLGRSLIRERSVLGEIYVHLPHTLLLAFAGIFVSLVVSVPLGILSALKQGTLADYAGTTLAMLGVSMPNFWLAILLILLFSLKLNWLPVFGMGGIKHLILPSITLGTGLAALSIRMIRGTLLDILTGNYIRTARARGLMEIIVVGKHAFRNALIPLVTVAGFQFAHLIEGAVIVESIFAWPGMGKLLVDAIFTRDFPMIQGCVLITTIMVVLINLTVDISYAFLDPRIRFERKGP